MRKTVSLVVAAELIALLVSVAAADTRRGLSGDAPTRPPPQSQPKDDSLGLRSPGPAALPSRPAGIPGPVLVDRSRTPAGDRQPTTTNKDDALGMWVLEAWWFQGQFESVDVAWPPLFALGL